MAEQVHGCESSSVSGTYAGLVSRLTALAIDTWILTIASLSLSVLPSLAWKQVIGPSPGWLGLISGIGAALLPWLYFTVCWWLNGQTAGSLLLGVAVQLPNGRKLPPLRAALRAGLGLAFAPVWLVGMVGVLWDTRRRAWHDVIFHTVVRYCSNGGRLAVDRIAAQRLDRSNLPRG